MGRPQCRLLNPDTKVWMDRMAARGWTAPEWPAEYGGGGLSKEENKVLQQELAAIKARPALTSFGLWMLGPALLEFASEEQKKKYIPEIIKGEIRWCQAIQSRVLDLTLPVCKPNAKIRAIIIWSTARKFGPLTPINAT